MKSKLIYTGLASLTVACGFSDASYLSLTDSNNTGKPLGSYIGSSVGTNEGVGNSVSENVDFSNAHQMQVKNTIQVGTNEFIRFQGLVQYVGNNMYGLPHFMEYLNHAIANYKPGTPLNTPKEIVITEEDKIKVTNFKKYFVDNCFELRLRDHEVTSEFSKFMSSNEKGFGSHRFNDNPVIYALMYFFDRNTSEVQIKDKYRSYNNYNFTFLPCTDKESGAKMDLTFDGGVIPSYSSSVTLSSEADTLKSILYSGMNGYNALYKFAMFKVAEDTFRLNIKLSSQESMYSSYSAPYIDQKIANIFLKIN